MKVINQKVYDDWKALNNDTYSSCVFRYLEKWANAMEEHLDKGEKLEDFAGKLSTELNDEGITYFMYGCAVNILSECWVYGKELKEWHNKKFNYTGDGVANPALITIEVNNDDSKNIQE